MRFLGLPPSLCSLKVGASSTQDVRGQGSNPHVHGAMLWAAVMPIKHTARQNKVGRKAGHIGREGSLAGTSHVLSMPPVLLLSFFSRSCSCFHFCGVLACLLDHFTFLCCFVGTCYGRVLVVEADFDPCDLE